MSSGAQLVLETGGLAELCSRQQTCIQRHTHAVPGTHCARLQRLPATSHKERQRQRRKARTKCVCEKEKDCKSGQRREEEKEKERVTFRKKKSCYGVKKDETQTPECEAETQP